MSINFDRLSVLAGLPATNSKLSEGAHSEKEEGMHQSMYNETEEADEMADTNEMYEEEAEIDEDDVMLEIDEAMLVQELRRAKRIMQESKRKKVTRNQNSKQKIFESELRKVIDEEVRSIFNEMNLTSGWVYGDNKPTRSRAGYTHQGQYMPGIGFKN